MASITTGWEKPSLSGFRGGLCSGLITAWMGLGLSLGSRRGAGVTVVSLKLLLLPPTSGVEGDVT